MSIIVKMRRQTAIVWRRGAADRYGKFAYEPPFQIACRWEDGRNQYDNAKGEIAFASAKMYPDQILAIGDRAIEGELDSTTPEDPAQMTGVVEIKRFDKTPNLKNTETLYTAYLV